MRQEQRALLCFVALAACIIPDREIGIESDDENPGAVRIVQRTPLSEDMLAVCDAEESEDRATEYCPQVPATRHSGLLEGNGGPLCVCTGDNDRDAHGIDPFFIYAEDPDRVQERPRDTLYAVALLDMDPFATSSPQEFVAYDYHLAPGGAGQLVENRSALPSDVPVAPSIGREDNFLWRFLFGRNGEPTVDLCNDNNGDKLTPGLHNLTIMVTDRPFFTPPTLDANGEPIEDVEGLPLQHPQYGMPDLAIGATYSVASWVFECIDEAMVAEDVCDCNEVPT